MYHYSWFFFFFHCGHVCGGRVWASEHRCSQGQKWASNPFELQCQAMWATWHDCWAINPGALQEQQATLSPWVISLALTCVLFCFVLFCFVLFCFVLFCLSILFWLSWNSLWHQASLELTKIHLPLLSSAGSRDECYYFWLLICFVCLLKQGFLCLALAVLKLAL